jgi:aryl-alcohol dehydrogenase-like predicted oxidoreductase
MLRRTFHNEGNSTMTVSALGLGGGPLGDLSFDDADADRLIRRAMDAGINVVDTAPSYGASETRIGRVIASMSAAARDATVVVTKGGYGVPGVPDWTPEVIERGIDQALARLSTDRIDAFVLHSCPLARLERGDLIAPLSAAKKAGKVRAIGYAGDGDALAWAVACDAFDVVECSVSVLDQEALTGALPRAAARGMGVLAKRSMAGAPWASASSAYVDRWRVMFPEGGLDGMPLDELFVRFAAHAPGVSSALMGTRGIERIEKAARDVARGPLPDEVVAELRRRFAVHGASWPGVI